MWLVVIDRKGEREREGDKEGGRAHVLYLNYSIDNDGMRDKYTRNYTLREINKDIVVQCK